MPSLQSTDNSNQPKLYYTDQGTGNPVILIHGWPLSHCSWNTQIRDLVTAGFRVIAYDRRGFGQSASAWDQYDYNYLAEDLKRIIDMLQLKNVSLVGYSMGGGEVVRYLTNYGANNISKAVLLSSIIPLVSQKDDNPDGVPQVELEKIMVALKTDRVGFLKDFHKNFYNYSLLNHTVSEGRLDADFIISSTANDNATIKCAESWAQTDFRGELKNVTVPTLIVHGDDDNIVPIATSAEQAAKGISQNEYHIIPGAPHGLNITHSKELGKILIDFLKK